MSTEDKIKNVRERLEKMGIISSTEEIELMLEWANDMSELEAQMLFGKDFKEKLNGV